MRTDETDTELGRLQKLIDVSDEQIAARCEPPMSKTTFQRAKKGKVPPETTALFYEALESVGQAQVERITKAIETARRKRRELLTQIA